MLKSKIKKLIKPYRGTGFPGDGKQRQLSEQMEIMKKLGVNDFFIQNFPKLLYCNQSYTPVADKIDVAKKLEEYLKSTEIWMNYAHQVPSLEGWIDSHGHDFKNPHPAIKYVVDTASELKPQSVLDVGAGAGVVSKYVYNALNGQLKLSCLEGSEKHLSELKQNFNNSDVIPPKIDVKAEIVKGIAQKLPFKDNSIEFIFTCTVMMHNPYIAAILAACEMARVSSKYILHVEGLHTDGITGFRDKYNLLLLDYERLYKELGFRMVKKVIYQDPYAKEYDYIVFLAEKM